MLPGLGLDAVAHAPAAGPTAPNQRQQFLTGLLAILAQHPQAASQGMGILQSVLGNIAQNKQANQDTRAQYANTAAQYAMQPGSSAEGLQALTGATYPQLADRPVAQNTLDTLFPNGGPSPLSPDAASSPDSLAPVDEEGIRQVVADGFSSVTDPTDPQQLNKIIDTVRGKAIALGKNSVGIAAATQYAKLILARLAETPRSDVVSTLDGTASTGTRVSNAFKETPLGWLIH